MMQFQEKICDQVLWLAGLAPVIIIMSNKYGFMGSLFDLMNFSVVCLQQQ